MQTNKATGSSSRVQTGGRGEAFLKLQSLLLYQEEEPSASGFGASRLKLLVTASRFARRSHLLFSSFVDLLLFLS